MAGKVCLEKDVSRFVVANREQLEDHTRLEEVWPNPEVHVRPAKDSDLEFIDQLGGGPAEKRESLLLAQM